MPTQVILWPLRPVGRGNHERRTQLQRELGPWWYPYRRAHAGRRGAQKPKYKQHRRK